MSADCSIELHDLRLSCNLGVTDEERSRRQVVVVNLDLELAAPRARHSDAIEDTVDYRDIVRCLQEECSAKQWKLLERMTAELGESLLSCFPLVERLRISIRKNVIPDAAGVTVTRVVERNNS